MSCVRYAKLLKLKVELLQLNFTDVFFNINSVYVLWVKCVVLLLPLSGSEFSIIGWVVVHCVLISNVYDSFSGNVVGVSAWSSFQIQAGSNNVLIVKYNFWFSWESFHNAYGHRHLINI